MYWLSLLKRINKNIQAAPTGRFIIIAAQKKRKSSVGSFEGERQNGHQTIKCDVPYRTFAQFSPRKKASLTRPAIEIVKNAAVNIVLRDQVPTELKQISSYRESSPDSTTQRTIPAILVIVFGKKHTGIPTTFSLEFLKECKKSLTVFARVN
ncbi:9881_t:CDS:2 [Dentiscutata erythropus]|uniref:9881_t:CDS:1 n=1 Tax=Dentiscutata erythropus TaxID=1348616 RepID=A0A9N9JN15_9GLOM|nr:9881_t:CDS:2 [Dentiscutata erythropus]